jgi:uncharacterized membrane protein
MATAPDPILFFGRLHPLLVHLPIGFLTLLAVIEIADRIHRFKGAAQAREVVLIVTVLSAIATVACGLMLSSAGGYDPSLLFWHKWMGITLACGTVAAAVAFWTKQPQLYVATIIFTLLILGPASHFGGSMTHGKNYLTAYAPAWLGGQSVINQPMVAVKPVADPSHANVFRDLVQPVIAANCLACHNADKNSGQLRLDSLELITLGGKSGPAITPGNSAASLLIQRIALPPADAKHMPPLGKPQPSDDQIELLQWWIDQDGKDQKTVADLNPSDEKLALVSRLLHIPVPAEPGAVPPVPMNDLQGHIAQLSQQIGIVVSLQTDGGPWIIVNGALSRSLGDKQLAELSPLDPNIIDLNLAGSHVTDNGLTALESMPNLQRLRLDRTAVTDAGLLHLKKLKKLEYLNLVNTSVTDAGLKTLVSLPSLRHLYLYKTGVDPKSAADFAAEKVDKNQIARLQKQIEKLQDQIASQKIEVVQEIKPTTMPTTPPTAPMSKTK